MDYYLGRYARSMDSAIVAQIHGGRLMLCHMLWPGAQTLYPVGVDSFGVEDFAERQVRFHRDGTGTVVSFELEGIGSLDGHYPRLPEDAVHPLELLAGGKMGEAALALSGQGDSVEHLLNVAATFFYSFPSKAAGAVQFYTALAQQYPTEPAVHAHLGRAQVAVGDRKQALTAYRQAHRLAPDNEDALLGLRRLGAAAGMPQEGWSVPYPMAALLAPPTAEEIALVQQLWQARDLSVGDVAVELEEEVEFAQFKGTVTILSHKVLGSRHFGAVFVPAVAEADSRGVLLCLKGVNPGYFPLNISEGPDILRVLGEDSGKFVYVIPCFRGETMIFGQHRFESEGDRTNAWEGATDDAIALLSVVLQAVPAADSSRVYCFGKSRGGTVALLAGQRDQRIKRVLAWSAPTDWFGLMTYAGWSMQEIVEDTLLNRWGSGEGGEAGQFVEWFVKPSIEGKRSLAAARLHILASSPLYFAHRLGRAQVHHGAEDNMVPVANARALMDRIERLPKAEFEGFVHPQAGHDVEYQTDEGITFSKSRALLLGCE